MKKIVFFLLVIAAMACLFWAVSRRPERGGLGKTKIVVSGYVPYTLVKQIAGNSADVLMLLPPGAEPHSFEPTPGALVALNQAEAFIYVSDTLEPWAADLAKTAGEKTRVLQLGKQILPGEDPHSWMNFDKTQAMARQIATLLAEIDPQNRAVFDKNLEFFTEQLLALHQAFSAELIHCKYQEVVHIGHLAFGNLLTPYGIQLTALSGTSHEGEHSAKKIAQLTREIKAKNLPAVFTEEVISPRLAQTVAAETGAEVLPLYSIEHISKHDFEHQVTYEDLMLRNLSSLKRGLVCQAF